MEDDSVESSSSAIIPPPVPAAVAAVADAQEDANQLIKQSCHDSGIDIRDPNTIIPHVQPIATKKNYSDADIVLSTEWVPPLTIAPTLYTETPSTNALSAQQIQMQNQNVETGGRKKTSSVSFSVDDNSEQGSSTSSDKVVDNKKNKMLKRLSYPLTWVEGLTSEGKPAETESAPNTGDSGQSVFSKVFSR